MLEVLQTSHRLDIQIAHLKISPLHLSMISMNELLEAERACSCKCQAPTGRRAASQYLIQTILICYHCHVKPLMAVIEGQLTILLYDLRDKPSIHVMATMAADETLPKATMWC